MTQATDNEMVPRWEWRMFAPSLEALEERLPPLDRIAPRTSNEVYFLRLGGPQNAKIRDDVFDVKQLRQVDAAGLELWAPVFKARFPLRRDDVIAAFGHWQLPLPKLARENYSSEAFIGDLIVAEPALRAVRVAKSRRGFAFAGCIAEFVRLSVESLPLQSFALEHEQPARILRALRDLGLEPAANTNYPAGLKHALGLANGQQRYGHQGAVHA